MLYGGNWFQIQLFSFLFGILAVGIAYFVGSMLGRKSITVLVLAGIAVSGMFQAMLSIVKYMADTESVLPSITFWLMGSLGKGNNRDILNMLVPYLFSLSFLYLFRNRINVLAVSEEETTSNPAKHDLNPLLSG